MDMSQYPRKLVYAPDPLRSTGPEYLWKGIDTGWTNADVVHRNAGIVGLLDGMRGIRPGVTAFITFIRDQTVADDDH